MDHTQFKRPPGIELIRKIARQDLSPAEEREIAQLSEELRDTSTAFILRTGYEWLRYPEAEETTGKLFGDLWYQHELCILFADTNVGKSILAVQIGDAISRGVAVSRRFGNECQAQKVLYFDFELSTRQFAQRYISDAEGRYHFDPNFCRLVLNPDDEAPQNPSGYAKYIARAIEDVVARTRARTVIIDNITCLRGGTEAAAQAISLMRSLQALKNGYELSILVLAHTPKRNPSRPITRNDLQGSKMLINFADSAFAIGESQTKPGTRYVKQIKQRSGAEVHGAAAVCLGRVGKPKNFIKLLFRDTATETAHLLPGQDADRHKTDRTIKQLHRDGKSVRSIATETGLSRSAVFRVVKKAG